MDDWTALGDSVEVSFDGYYLVVRADDNPAKTVYLEEPVLAGLIRYAKQRGLYQDVSAGCTHRDLIREFRSTQGPNYLKCIGCAASFGNSIAH